MTTNLIPISDIERMAKAVATSGLFGMKSPEQAMALMLVAQAEGLHPATAARDYHVIQGRPALKADAMLARFQQAGGKVAWDAYTDEKVSAVFTHEAGGSVKIEWDMARAKKAGLGGKDNWSKYPRQMLRSRVISEGIRTCYPAVCAGVYTPEEVADFTPAADAPRRGRPPKDMGKAEIVPDADGVLDSDAVAKEQSEADDAKLREIEMRGTTESPPESAGAATPSAEGPPPSTTSLSPVGGPVDPGDLSMLPMWSEQMQTAMDAIYDAADAAALKATAALCKAIPDEREKAVARKAYSDRMKELSV